ncbi:MAG: hypothetical protein ABI402_13655 [Ferruginibacter sp.]
MKTENTRLIVYPKDVQRITGKSERWGRMLLQKVMEKLNKEEHQMISVEEFCMYTGLKIDQVLPFMID